LRYDFNNYVLVYLHRHLRAKLYADIRAVRWNRINEPCHGIRAVVSGRSFADFEGITDLQEAEINGCFSRRIGRFLVDTDFARCKIIEVATPGQYQSGSFAHLEYIKFIE